MESSASDISVDISFIDFTLTDSSISQDCSIISAVEESMHLQCTEHLTLDNFLMK